MPLATIPQAAGHGEEERREEELGPVAAWLSSVPSWREATDRAQELSRSTAEAKLREAAPWVAGEMAPPPPLVRAEDLQRGDPVFRRGLPAEVVQAHHGAVVVRMRDSGSEVSSECDYLSLGTEASQHCLLAGVRVCLVSLQNKAELNGCHGALVEFQPQAQRWTVRLDGTDEVIRVHPQNLSVLLAPSGGRAPASPVARHRLEAGAQVRLEGLQGRPELNGKQGVLVEFSTEANRWKVKLHPAGETISAHPRNLTVHGAAAQN
mmetsp:Transcript_106942/g.297816  ORF Transcript_106942/g.297816 Transcript_106942/m.297816 type:complete len:264 (+) Transcript_106942:121-912(+)